MRPSALAAALCALLLGLTACADRLAGLPPLEPTASAAYRLGPEDRVRLTVFGEDRISNLYVVDDNGAISLPLAGRVEIGGLTVAEAERAVGKRLVETALRDPSVGLQIEQYRPFYVTGEVFQPGRYAFSPGLTVQAAIAVGGGYTTRASRDGAIVSRVVGGRVVDRRGLPSDLVAPGDVVTVVERPF